MKKGISMRAFVFSSALMLIALPAAANDFDVQMASYLHGGDTNWLTDPALVAAVQAQNVTTAAFTEAEILALDATWRAQIGTGDMTLINSVLGNATADFLRDQVAASGGVITEIILMDARGLNVAISSLTSDYWQGDEAKHQATYGVGVDAVHFSDIELDESSQRYQGQISVTLVDPATGEPIGAVTIGVDALALS
jgi:hypothetical protein